MRSASKAPITFLILTFVTVLSLPAAAAEFDSERFAGIVEDGMAAWHVPGMAVAVIDEGEVVFQQGFGVTSPKGGKAVDFFGDTFARVREGQ